VSADTIEGLRAAFSGRLITEPAQQAPFLTDWRGRWSGSARAVVQPDRAADVAAVLRWCHTHRVPVVPQGGNTGLSGGSVPDGSGRAIVLSLTRLNRIRSIDARNNTLVAEAGCVLQVVQEAAREADRLFPLSLAAQGSCTIGGNLATNAGGVQVLRYGNARRLCLGLEVVTPQGELWDGLRGLRKDNTGYDLRDLYIGAEGTLGVITAAVLELHPLPKAQVCAFVAVPTPSHALALLALAQQRAGPALSAFELVSQTCLGLVLKHFAGCRNPLVQPSPWYLLLEIDDLHDQARASAAAEQLLEAALEAGHATDAVVATSVAQRAALWALRENISQAQAAEGKNIKHDIAVPISRIAEFVAATDALIAAQHPGVRMVVFGHLGDGNLHYNVSPPVGVADTAFLDRQDDINRITHDSVARFGGSISAEHGLGVLRRDEAARYKSPVELALMRSIKNALDPLGIMNPGKLLAAP
jgi:FAD/FMN-containing dehydrogenase